MATRGTPNIVVNGGLAGNANALDFSAGNSTVEGLIIQQFRQYAPLLETDGEDTVTGDFIGTDVTGSVALGNGAGILVTSASNLIGGTTRATRTVIAGNTGAGIQINGAGAHNNSVIGNDIGTDFTGTLSWLTPAAALQSSMRHASPDRSGKNTQRKTAPAASGSPSRVRCRANAHATAAPFIWARGPAQGGGRTVMPSSLKKKCARKMTPVDLPVPREALNFRASRLSLRTPPYFPFPR